MRDYALLRNGEIFNILTSPRSLEQIRENYWDYDVEPVEYLSRDVLARYRYWEERP